MMGEVLDQYRAEGLTPADRGRRADRRRGIRRRGGAGIRRCGGTRLVGVEATDADCVAASIEHGEVTTIPGPQVVHDGRTQLRHTVSHRLARCIAGYDSFVTITDDQVADAMRLLAADDIVSGESGAAGLGGLLAHRDVLA